MAGEDRRKRERVSVSGCDRSRAPDHAPPGERHTPTRLHDRPPGPAEASELVRVLDLPGPPRTSFRRSPAEIELFYDVHLTPWLQLTGDLQVIRPIRRDLDDAIVPGARLKIVF